MIRIIAVLEREHHFVHSRGYPSSAFSLSIDIIITNLPFIYRYLCYRFIFELFCKIMSYFCKFLSNTAINIDLRFYKLYNTLTKARLFLTVF